MYLLLPCIRNLPSFVKTCSDGAAGRKLKCFGANQTEKAFDVVLLQLNITTVGEPLVNIIRRGPVDIHKIY